MLSDLLKCRAVGQVLADHCEVLRGSDSLTLSIALSTTSNRDIRIPNNGTDIVPERTCRPL